MDPREGRGVRGPRGVDGDVGAGGGEGPGAGGADAGGPAGDEGAAALEAGSVGRGWGAVTRNAPSGVGAGETAQKEPTAETIPTRTATVTTGQTMVTIETSLEDWR